MFDRVFRRNVTSDWNKFPLRMSYGVFQGRLAARRDVDFGPVIGKGLCNHEAGSTS